MRICECSNNIGDFLIISLQSGDQDKKEKERLMSDQQAMAWKGMPDISRGESD